MRKRLIRAVAIAIVAALAAAVMVVFVWLDGNDEATASYRSLDYDVTVQTNGDLKIVQHIDYQLKEREDNSSSKYWRQLYWQYTLDSTNLTNITDIMERALREPLVHRRCDEWKQLPRAVRHAERRSGSERAGTHEEKR